MALILMFLVILITGRIMVAAAKKAAEPKIKKRFCPPHKWVDKEQPEAQPGEYQYYMVCSICGKLPGQENGTEF